MSFWRQICFRVFKFFFCVTASLIINSSEVFQNCYDPDIFTCLRLHILMSRGIGRGQVGHKHYKMILWRLPYLPNFVMILSGVPVVFYLLRALQKFLKDQLIIPNYSSIFQIVTIRLLHVPIKSLRGNHLHSYHR